MSSVGELYKKVQERVVEVSKECNKPIVSFNK